MRKKRSIFAVCLAMTVVLTGCGAAERNPENIVSTNSAASSAPADPERYSASFMDAFDTVTSIVGYAENEEAFQEQTEKLNEMLMTYHRFYDIYHEYEGINNLYTVNAQAGIEPVEVGEEILDLLELGKEMYEETNGQVNIAMGAVLSIWHEYREKGTEDPDSAELPDMQELQEAAAHTDIENLIIDREASTVYFKDPEMSLDVGGIGKGYAVQKLYEYAGEFGIEHLLISVGGNVMVRGDRIDGTSWVLGIQNPDTSAEEEYIAKVSLEDSCLVTSGDYQRYYTVDGVRYCHIIDPDTLMPAAYYSSVSIITADSGRADALSTAVFNMEFEDAEAFVNSLDGTEAMWVFADGTIAYSDGFQAYLK